MGSAEVAGEDRAIRAAEAALASPLLNDNDIAGAKYILLNITYGETEVLMDEISEITDHIQSAAGSTADVIWGYGQDPSLNEELRVTIIATGFDHKPDTGIGGDHIPEKKYHPLGGEMSEKVTSPITSPISSGTQEVKTVQAPEVENVEEEPYLKKEESAEEPQTAIEFEVSTPQEVKEAPVQEETTSEKEEKPAENEKIYHDLNEPVNTDVTPEDIQVLSHLSYEEQQQKAAERVTKMKELNMRLRTPSGLVDLESEPAFRRKNVELEDVPHSSESKLSKYTLGEENGENGERRTGLRPDNPFVNPQVD